MNRPDLAEIEDNDLAQATMSVVERIRPHLLAIALAVAVAFASLAAWTLVSSQREGEQQRAWDEILAALGTRDAGRLAAVADRYPESAAAVWSQILLADNALADGGRMVFVDRSGGRQRLEAAAAAYKRVVDSPTAPPRAAERAIFGLARAREALGELADARLGYESIVREHPTSPLRGLAEARASALARPSTAAWYDWFATDAKPAAPGAKPAESGTAAPAG